MDQYDVIVIGGGLEGVASALRAAREGRRVALFEARALFGGRLCHVEPFESADAVPFAHLLWGIDPRTFRLLGLRPTELGLTPAPHLSMVAEDGEVLTFSAEAGLTRTMLDARAPFEIERLNRLRAALVRATRAQSKLRKAAEAAPRRRGAAAEDDAMAWAQALGSLDRQEQRELMAISIRPLTEYLGGFLSDPLLVAAVQAPALFAHAIGPKVPGAALGLLKAPPLMPAASERFVMPLVVGAAADDVHKVLMKTLRDQGITFEIGCKVTELCVERGGVTGVGLADGRRVGASEVISTLDAKATMLGLVDWKEMPGAFVRRMGGLALKGSLARIFLRIDELPPEEAREIFRGPIYFNMNAADNAADSWRADHLARQLPFEVTVRVADGFLKQTHVSAFAQFTPNTPDGDSWTSEHVSGVLDGLMGALEKLWPNVSNHVKDWALWTPADLETHFGWSHGAASGAAPGPAALVDQSGLPEFASGHTPIKGLYLGRAPKGAKLASRRKVQSP